MNHPRIRNRRPTPAHGTPEQRHARATERRVALTSRRPATGAVHALGEPLPSKSAVIRLRVGRTTPGA
jgi:hypothetical protein